MSNESRSYNEIKELMKDSRYSYRKLSKEFGYDFSHIRKVLTNKESYPKAKKLKKRELFISIAGELPARILKGILSNKYSSHINAIGLPPLKIPHVARVLYEEENSILDERKKGL